MARRREFLFTVGSASAAFAQPSAGGAAGKRFGIGLIGCGNRGSYLAQTASRLGAEAGDAEVVAVCDIYQPRLERLASRLKAKEYKRADELIADPKVSAVIVATPDRWHAAHALAAVRAGKDVYCEKPLAHWQQWDVVKELVAEVRRRKSVFQIGTQRLADPVWRNAAELIRRGEVGKPVHVQMGYFRRGDTGERGMKIDDPQAKPGVGLDWEAFLGDAPRRPFSVTRFFQWRLYLDYSGGPVTDNDVHFLVLMLKALGVKFPRAAVALGGKYQFHTDPEREVPDTFDLILQYPEGLSLTFVGSYCNDTPADHVIRGTEGTMTFREAGAVLEPLAGVARQRRELAHLDVSLEHMRDFLRCVRTRETPQGDIDLAYYTQAAVTMAMRAFVEGRVARFDTEREEIVMG